MISIYASYGSINCEDERETLEDAKDLLQSIEDEGEGFALGVYDPITKTMHIPQNMNIAGQPEGAVLLQKQEEFRKLGLEINTIAVYDKSI